MTDPAIDRRDALRRLGLAGIAAGEPGRVPAVAQGAGLKRPRSTLRSTCSSMSPIATIQPSVYGQFAEHIGGVIYDGIWVGRDSKIANTDGIRQAIIDHVKKLGPVVVRWPGRVLRRQVPLARRHRPAVRAASSVRPMAGRDRDQPVRHA